MNVSGIVEAGSGRGRGEFVPTLNLMLEFVPDGLEFAIYACRVCILGSWYEAVVHYGPRTSVDGLCTFEVNVFDFDQQVYGQKVEVEVLDKIRGIVKFDNISDLKNQIEQDILKAKEIHKRRHEKVS